MSAPQQNPQEAMGSGTSETMSHRLYVQFKVRAFFIHPDFPSKVPSQGISFITTVGKPVDMFILSADVSTKKALKSINTHQTLTIIIEGNSHASLQEFAQIYTTYWDSVPFINQGESLCFDHIYRTNTVKKFIRDKHTDSEIIVVNTNKFHINYMLLFKFDGLFAGAKGFLRYTLHVKFKKSDFQDGLNSKHKGHMFRFKGVPIEGVLSDQGGAIDCHSNCEYSGSTIEFLFKSNDLAGLQSVRDKFMSLYLPSEKYRYRSCQLSFSFGSLKRAKTSIRNCSIVRYEVIIASSAWQLYPIACFTNEG